MAPASDHGRDLTGKHVLITGASSGIGAPPAAARPREGAPRGQVCPPAGGKNPPRAGVVGGQVPVAGARATGATGGRGLGRVAVRSRQNESGNESRNGHVMSE